MPTECENEPGLYGLGAGGLGSACVILLYRGEMKLCKGLQRGRDSGLRFQGFRYRATKVGGVEVLCWRV